MTIQTIEFIHETIKSEVETRLRAYEHIYNIVSEAIANNQDNVEFLKEQQTLAWKKYTDAKFHLIEFEEKEW